jgi:hypothetical protein
MRIRIHNWVHGRQIACKYQRPSVLLESDTTSIVGFVTGTMTAAVYDGVVIVDFIECLDKSKCSFPETICTCQSVLARAFTTRNPISFSNHSFLHVFCDSGGIIQPELLGCVFKIIGVSKDCFTTFKLQEVNSDSIYANSSIQTYYEWDCALPVIWAVIPFLWSSDVAHFWRVLFVKNISCFE